MLSKAQIKYIRSLQNKKLRHTNRVYVIEGEKIVAEYIQSDYPIDNIYAVDEWLEANPSLLQNKKLPVTKVSDSALKQISSLTTPNKVLALARMPKISSLEEMESLFKTGLHLALENIQDPGNLGTLIRTADWFGVDSIICSADCVDAYNFKVVQATMGSLSRVKIFYEEMHSFIKTASLPVYAATLNGENIFNQKLPSHAIVLIGNESMGLSPTLVQSADKEICIPRFGKAESLNAAIAAAVILAVFRAGVKF